ncbi:phage holin [Clostridium sp.]|uniref:phage holin n=1 Tax=Clostridium sp. TaxID=1506 RepID=UPI00263A1421|nr:phage holin [Clostridium sp.]
MNINLKARLKNKAFWIALVSGVVGFTQLFGVKVFPENWADILNTILGLLVGLGIIVDTSTEGISDRKEEV